MARNNIEPAAGTQAQYFVVAGEDIVAIWLLGVGAGVIGTLAALLGWRAIHRSRSGGDGWERIVGGP